MVKEKHTKYVNEDSRWLKQAMIMLQRKDFDNAKKCFSNMKSNDKYQYIDRIKA